VVVSTIVIYAILLFIFEKIKQKRLHKSKIYSAEDRAIKDRKTIIGPVDVRNEYNRVQQSLEDEQAPGTPSNINNNMVLRIFQISKYYVKNTKEIRKKEKEGHKNENEIEVMDRKRKNNAFDSITYDPKKNKYINRIVDDVTFGVNTSECLVF